jgi:hypothetical protein
MKKFTTALACVFALTTTSALANSLRHRPGTRIHGLHRDVPQLRSGFLHPNDGNPGGTISVSAGGYLWNGRSASEFGGD